LQCQTQTIVEIEGLCRHQEHSVLRRFLYWTFPLSSIGHKWLAHMCGASLVVARCRSCRRAERPPAVCRAAAACRSAWDPHPTHRTQHEDRTMLRPAAIVIFRPNFSWDEQNIRGTVASAGSARPNMRPLPHHHSDGGRLSWGVIQNKVHRGSSTGP
jgi:hypothetical protein